MRCVRNTNTVTHADRKLTHIKYSPNQVVQITVLDWIARGCRHVSRKAAMINN